MITNYFIEKRINRAIHDQRYVSLIDFSKAKSIALVSVITKGMQYESIGDDLKHFSLDSNNEYFFYAPAKLQMTEEICGGKLNKISMKDFSFFCYPKNQLVSKLESKQFDLLINIDFSNNILSHYLSASIPANFKIGLSGEAFSNVYDLTLRMAENNTIESYFKHLNFYLKALIGNQ